MQLVEITKDKAVATMPVDRRTCQPYGLLAGGATLALAETLAGAGSIAGCDPEHVAVGISVSAEHVASARLGQTVTAVATPVHLGKRRHVWNVDVSTEEGKLISSVRVTNLIVPRTM